MTAYSATQTAINKRAAAIRQSVREDTFRRDVETCRTHSNRHGDTLSDLDTSDILTTSHGPISAYALARALDGDVDAASYFASDETFARQLSAAVLRDAQELAAFACGYTTDAPRFVLEVGRLRDVGCTIRHDPATGTTRETFANAATFVFDRDVDSPLGIALVTAYPRVSSATTPLATNRDLTDDLRLTRTYRDASPVRQAWLECGAKAQMPPVASFVSHNQLEIPLSAQKRTALVVRWDRDRDAYGIFAKFADGRLVTTSDPTMERNLALVRAKRPEAMTLAQEVAARANRIERELGAEAEASVNARDLTTLPEPARDEVATANQQFH